MVTLNYIFHILFLLLTVNVTNLAQYFGPYNTRGIQIDRQCMKILQDNIRISIKKERNQSIYPLHVVLEGAYPKKKGQNWNYRHYRNLSTHYSTFNFLSMTLGPRTFWTPLVWRHHSCYYYHRSIDIGAWRLNIIDIINNDITESAMKINAIQSWQ